MTNLPTTMSAVAHLTYGPPEALDIRAMAVPSVKPNEVLIRAHASSVNAADRWVMRGTPYLLRLAMGLRKPKHPILGMDIAGTIVAKGPKVTRFEVGDAVYGQTTSAYAEYVVAAETLMVSIPAELSFEQAAVIPLAGTTALIALAGVEPGQKVLINGASGGVGSFAVQIAKAKGAHVTAVCSTQKMNMVSALGADAVIDYTKESFTDAESTYDLILDLVGDRELGSIKATLKPKGVLAMSSSQGGAVLGPLARILKGALMTLVSSRTIKSVLGSTKQQHLEELAPFIQSGQIVPSVDKVFPLANTLDAIRYFEAGSTRGKIAIQIKSNQGED
jgi:NADPH:quinone reductase-like Zn-dependent oxidoreductase